MKIAVLVFSTLLSLAYGIDAQKAANTAKVLASSGALDKSKPTIYVEYDRRVTEQKSPDSKSEYVLLRLRNNSRWSIVIDTSGGMDEKLRDATLYYDVVDLDEKIVSRHRCHVCSTNALKPGRKIKFMVPSDELSDGLSIRINFSFEWEDAVQVATGLEPTHYVLFSFRDLPQ